MLILAALVLNVAAQAYSIPVTRYIRESSTSVNADIALRFAYFAFMLLVAVVEALLVDDLLSGGAWRKRFLGGLKPGAGSGRRPGDQDSVDLSDEEFEAALGSRRSGLRFLIAESSLSFFLAFFVLLGLNWLMFNALNGWFDLYYGRGGHYVTQLRSPDARLRCEAILELSYRRSARVGLDLERALADRLEEGTPKEKVWAAWALGYRRKLKLPARPTEQVERAEDLLVSLLERGTDRQRQVAAVAAARYLMARGERASARLLPAIRSLARSRQASGKMDVETAVALGLLGDKPEVALLGELLLRGEQRLAEVAAWALGRMQHRSSLRPLLGGLDKAPAPVRCAIVRALGRLGSAARVSVRLMAEFNHKSSGFVCAARKVVLRPDGRGKKIVDQLVLAKMARRYRVLLLQTMAKVSFLPDALPWLDRVSRDPAFHKQTRGYAREYYRSLKRQMAREQ